MTLCLLTVIVFLMALCAILLASVVEYDQVGAIDMDELIKYAESKDD